MFHKYAPYFQEYIIRKSLTGDANGPMTNMQWKRSIKFNASTHKMMKNVEAACGDFLASKASGKHVSTGGLYVPNR